MDDLLTRHNAVMGDGAPMFYDQPLELVEGDGVWMVDADGTRYLDLYNNVPCVGHGNPRVARAVADQAARLNVHSRYLHANVIEYAERLVGLHHDGIESMIMACTGTEATETALTMARTVTGKQGLICTDATYHGNSSLVGQMRRLPVGVDRGSEIRSITTPQMFRPAVPDMTEAELCDWHIAELQATIDDFEARGVGFAGIMLCTILANEGLVDVPTGWFKRAVQVVRDAGGLIIADEVQAGFGRSGRWWGYETNGFEPDIVCMGKPMGNGFPVSGVASSADNVGAFRRENFYFNTYAGSPLQAAAGMAVLDEITDRGLVENVATMGEHVQAGLKALASDHASMGDVRGDGLFIGIDWVHPGTNEPDPPGAAAVVEAFKARGALLGRAGEFFNVIKIRPPIVFGEDDAAHFLDLARDILIEAR